MEEKSHNDLIAAILSSLAIIIQLLLFVLGTVASSLNAIRIFSIKELIPFITLIAIFLSLSLAGIYSFFHKNPTFFPHSIRFRLLRWLRNSFFDDNVQEMPGASTMSKRLEKTILLISFFILIFSTLIFVVTTVAYLTHRSVIFFSIEDIPIWQTLSYLIMWTLTTFILFIWISNEKERKEQFKEEDFVKNLYGSLREQGYLSILAKEIEQLPGINFRYVIIKLNDGTTKFFKVSFNAKRIEKEFSDENAYFQEKNLIMTLRQK